VPRQQPQGVFDQLKALLLKDYKAGITPVVLIDEAQQLEARALESLRGYLNFETASEKVLQIILFAMPNIVRKLAYVHSLRNRLVKTELVRMDRQEVEEMLRWRFAQAGGKLFPFENGAIDTLFNLTQGNPRTTRGSQSWRWRSQRCVTPSSHQPSSRRRPRSDSWTEELMSTLFSDLEKARAQQRKVVTSKDAGDRRMSAQKVTRKSTRPRDLSRDMSRGKSREKPRDTVRDHPRGASHDLPTRDEITDCCTGVG
jgi:hypothetical protein